MLSEGDARQKASFTRHGRRQSYFAGDCSGQGRGAHDFASRAIGLNVPVHAGNVFSRLHASIVCKRHAKRHGRRTGRSNRSPRENDEKDHDQKATET